MRAPETRGLAAKEKMDHSCLFYALIWIFFTHLIVNKFNVMIDISCLVLYLWIVSLRYMVGNFKYTRYVI